MRFRFLIASALGVLLAAPVFSQGANVAFGNMQQESSGPVEISADNMAINQNTGTGELTGNVLIGQGDLRLSAASVDVVYSQDRKQIASLKASGGVTLVSGEDAAEANTAVYDISSGQIVLTGDVLLVQGPTAITADSMQVDTEAGTARMEGRVKTVLNVDN